MFAPVCENTECLKPATKFTEGGHYRKQWWCDACYVVELADEAEREAERGEHQAKYEAERAERQAKYEAETEEVTEPEPEEEEIEA